MKKIIIRILFVTILCTLTACGSKSTAKNPGISPTLEGSEDSESIFNPNQNTMENKEEPKKENEIEKEINFEEITVVDNEFCTIKITDVKPNEEWGYNLYIFMENKSPEKNYMFTLDSCAINGVQIDPTFSQNVLPGKKANEVYDLSYDDLNDYTFLDCSNIKLTFRVYDSDDWYSGDVAYETTYVYPLGKEHATTFVREAKPTDIIIVDNKQIKIVFTGYNIDPYGYNALFYLINKTEDELDFEANDVTVNGYMIDPYWFETVKANNILISRMSWNNEEFEMNHIEKVQEIEMELQVGNSEKVGLTEVYKETVTIQP